jgi:hypothetical protein
MCMWDWGVLRKLVRTSTVVLVVRIEVLYEKIIDHLRPAASSK